MTIKQEFSAVDAAPSVLYAKTSSSSFLAYPVLATSTGCLMVSSGLDIPGYDTINLSYSGSNLSTVQFYVGGTGGTLVATLSLSYSGSNLQTVVRS